jgi:hypothetical protein
MWCCVKEKGMIFFLEAAEYLRTRQNHCLFLSPFDHGGINR